MSDVTLLVGTKKGLFSIRSKDSRGKWETPGPPAHEGLYVNHAMRDPRTGRIWACLNSELYGPRLAFSDDLGKTWQDCDGPTNPAEPIERFWVISPGPKDGPGTVFCGSAPAELWRTDDGGNTWQINEGLRDHETHPKWQPGNGGLCLHSIVQDPRNPNKMWVGISAVGVFATEDGGKTWETRNKNTRADFFPEAVKFPEFGQCVHKVAMDAADPECLYQQNHCGMYRTEDGGRNWIDIGDGKLPTRFGFPIAAHPRKPGTIWIAPMGSDERRFMTDGKMCVYKSPDGGESWQPKTKGLPQDAAYVTVLREAMCVDGLDPCGVYVGTSGGVLFGSRDEGESWMTVSPYLPPISSVSAFE